MKAIGPPAIPEGITTPTLELPRAKSHGRGIHLWFVRHAEVAEKYHDMAYGSMNVELSERGQEQTARMARAFGKVTVDRIMSSHLDRARVMGEGIAASTGAPMETSENLREMDRGDWQGLKKSVFIDNWHGDAANYWKDPYHWHVPNGEGDSRLFERAYPLLAEAIEQQTSGTLLITAHGQLIRILISRFLGLSVPDSYEYYPDPAHATCLEDTPAGWTLLKRNLSPDEVGT
jgi:broad specificity phosphatase PhoE